VSDNPTRETPDSRSFEERVFARFDALDARMGRFETRLDTLETKVDGLGARLSSLENKVDALGGRLTALEGKVDSLEEKVDSRLRETRPIWEGVLARLTAIESELPRLRVIESELSRMNRQFRSYVADIFQLRVRVEKLEEDADKQAV
jgi:predicted nuclease with TOPRIM domain